MAEFIAWHRGNRIDKAGLTLLSDENIRSRMVHDYECVLAHLAGVCDTSGEPVDPEAELGNNKRVTLVSDVAYAPQRHHRIFVDVHPELLRHADVRFPHILEPGEEGVLEGYVTLHRKFDVWSLPYLFKLYLLA